MKQTAVEFLESKLTEYLKRIYKQEIEQAKEMEKIKENNFNKMLEMLKEIKNQIEDGRTYITKEDMEQLIKEVTKI